MAAQIRKLGDCCPCWLTSRSPSAEFGASRYTEVKTLSLSLLCLGFPHLLSCVCCCPEAHPVSYKAPALWVFQQTFFFSCLLDIDWSSSQAKNCKHGKLTQYHLLLQSPYPLTSFFFVSLSRAPRYVISACCQEVLADGWPHRNYSAILGVESPAHPVH